MLKPIIMAVTLLITHLAYAAAPTITSMPDQTVFENSAMISVNVKATDADNDTLFLSQTISNTNLATLSMTNFWSQTGAYINGKAVDDHSGGSVSLSADGLSVAIGAAYNADLGIDSGHVRVYKNIAGTWVKAGADINGELPGDLSGTSVSLSADGSILAIGAVGNDKSGSNSGHVRVYKNYSGTWMQFGADIDGEAANDRSGHALSLSADGLTLAIGAPFNDGAGTDSGQVRVYKYNTGTWTQLGADIEGEMPEDYSGGALSLSADGLKIAIGASGNDAHGSNSGHVRVFEYNAGTWTQLGTDIDGKASGDFTSPVSLSADGSRVAVGARANDDNGFNSGQVRIFEYNAGTWTQLGNDINGEAANDQSATSISLSADGLTVAIGAPRNSANGTYSGHVRIYKFSTGIWTQVGADLNAVAAYDNFGGSVSMSADGLHIAIGAKNNSSFHENGGQVRVYNLKNTLSITPKANAYGTAVVTLTAIDGTGSDANSSFNLTITGIASSSSSSAVSGTASSSSSSVALSSSSSSESSNSSSSSSAVVVSSSSSSFSSAVSSSSSSSSFSSSSQSSIGSSSSSGSVSSASDTDGDGVHDAIEQSVPNPDENGYGDGNGDNTQDYMQTYVSAVQGTNGWLVLGNTQHYGQSDLYIQTAPSDRPDDISFPYGFIAFQINGVPYGESVEIELYVPYDGNINGYWKKDNGGSWHNIAASVTRVGAMTKITFALRDGGAFDSDGTINGVIADPGAPGARAAAVAVPLSDTAKMLLMLLFIAAAALVLRTRYNAGLKP